MFNVQNMKKLFLALLLIATVPALCMADGKGHHRMKHGTMVNVGAHADLPLLGETLRLVVQYVNPSNNPITIKEIKIFRPDGIEPDPAPDFAAAGLEPPFELGPFQAKGFALSAVGIDPEEWSPMTGVFQVHTKWKSRRSTNGLKSFSIIITRSPYIGNIVTGKHSIEGFDIKDKKHKDD